MGTNPENHATAEKLHSHVGKGSYEDGFRERGRLELERRLGMLQSRRNHLENELQAVKNCLSSLDQQIRNYSDYEQLSIRD